jgi:hypothetical protein
MVEASVDTPTDILNRLRRLVVNLQLHKASIRPSVRPFAYGAGYQLFPEDCKELCEKQLPNDPELRL